MIKAIIFDMNGVIIDDENFHNESWKIFCDKYNLDIDYEELRKITLGRRDIDTLKILFKRELTNEEAGRYSDERDKIVEELIKGKLYLPIGLIDLLENIKLRKIPTALATGARREYVDFILERFSLREYFDVIVTADEVSNGKPDPEIYLKSAKLINSLPGECLVFEDSIHGIKSAKSAGMKVVAITSSIPKEELSKIADEVIYSFKEFDLNQIG